MAKEKAPAAEVPAAPQTLIAGELLDTRDILMEYAEARTLAAVNDLAKEGYRVCMLAYGGGYLLERPAREQQPADPAAASDSLPPV
jgi:magnesium-transporting ATPase (P-type)